MHKSSTTFQLLSIMLSALAMVLVITSTIIRVSWPENAPVDTIHWATSGVTILLALSVVIYSKRNCPQYRFITMLTTGLLALSIVQLIPAALAVSTHHPVAVAGQLLAILLMLGLALALTTTSRIPATNLANPGVHHPEHKYFFRSILLTGLGFLLLLVTGALVTATESGMACADWPLCRGEIFPADFTLDVAINLLHRFTVVAIGMLIAAVILQTRRQYAGYTTLSRWSTTLGLLFLVQIGLGALYSLDGISPNVIKMVHLGLTATIWGCLVILATICYLTVETAVPLPPTEPAQSPSLTVKQRAATYFKLTKPWILVLLLITTVTAMVIAAEGLPPISLILYTMLGGALSAGGASVLNSYVDSDIDHLMSRTSRRATVTGLVTPNETLVFGLTLSVLSFLIFAIFVNMYSAVLSTIGILYYVFFYTLYLKRTTIHTIIIGGAAGAIPPLVGWTAVTGSLSLGAFYLFAIIFFWTPPHTWAMALMVKKDYARAKVPMLPVVVGEKETSYQIFLYSILLITLTLLPFTFQMVSWVYFAAALILGIRFLHLAWKLWQNYTDKAISRKLYKYSQSYLALLFLIMALDRSLM